MLGVQKNSLFNRFVCGVKDNMPQINIVVGNKIRQRRIQLAITVEALAKSVGVSANTMEKIESGDTRAAAHTLVEIARVLRVTLSYFFEE